MPVVGIAGMELAKSDCKIEHNLSDYPACCAKDSDGEIIECMKPGITALGFKKSHGGDFTDCCLVDKILTIGDWIFTALLVVAILVILLAAWGFLTAGGDPEKVKKSRDYLIYALVGIAVAFLAKVLVRVVASIMT